MRPRRGHRAQPPDDQLRATRAAPHVSEVHEDAGLLRAAMDGVRDLVVICDPHGGVRFINRAMERFTGIEASEIVQEQWSACGAMHHPDGEAFSARTDPMSRTLRGETVRDEEILFIGVSGHRRAMTVDGEQLTNRAGVVVGAIVVCRDVTDRRHAEDQLVFHSHHDSLTGLPNRRLFIRLIEQALARAQPARGATAVLALNIDHFGDISTRIGDRSGDHSGERFLIEIARRVGSSLHRTSRARPLGALAHIGGDHFLVLCEDVAGAGAVKLIARRISDALGGSLSIAGEDLNVTACIGMTLTRDPLRDAEPLIREAEAAMRDAQQRGPGQHAMFTGEIHTERIVRIANESSLRMALDRGEFYVEYQPKISLVTDRTVGVEALLRWMHPERGLVGPLDFIPLAEKSGIIVQIGAWVLEQVCRDAMRWRTALPGGHPLMVAVNVSPRQFESDLAERFGGIIGRSGIDPATVCLEVTESMVMQDADLAIATLRDLKSLGLSISVDDFGTGFSSLAYLKRFPLDELKIDKSFVDGLGHDSEATAIVAAVMGMAHALDLRVVAEGVETADQAVRLRTLGCDEAQGFFYARPGAPGAIDARLVAEARAHAGATAERGRRHPESAHIGKILVVDDANDVRQLARSSLAAVGFEIREAASGEDAVTMARHFGPDCIVLDVNLPGISGFDVCRIMRDDPANQSMTIVILTGDVAPSEKIMAFSLGADDYMVKPFSPRDLVSRVTSAIRRRGELIASGDASIAAQPAQQFTIVGDVG